VISEVEAERVQCNVLFVDELAEKVVVADETFDQVCSVKSSAVKDCSVSKYEHLAQP
jgi:hypothetical protein